MGHRSRLGHASSIVVLSVVASGGCAGHRVATTFAELEPRMKRGQTIYLTTAGGSERKGILESLSAGGAQVRISGTAVQVAERDTVRISVAEPLWQGALVGAVVGGFMGGAAQQVGEGTGCILSMNPDCNAGGTPVLGMLMGAGLGSGVGAGIDALVWRRKRIFAAPQTTRLRLELSPIAGRRTKGLQVTASF